MNKFITIFVFTSLVSLSNRPLWGHFTLRQAQDDLSRYCFAAPQNERAQAALNKHTQYEYLYNHLLHPITGWENISSMTSYEAQCFTIACTLAASTTWVAKTYLAYSAPAKSSAIKHQLKTKKNGFVHKLDALKNRYSEIKRQSNAENGTTTTEENNPQWLSIQTILLTVALAAGYYWGLKQFVMSQPTPYADRFTDFLDKWPMHTPHVAPHLHSYFDELYELHILCHDHWTLREDVAKACLGMLAQVA